MFCFVLWHCWFINTLKRLNFLPSRAIILVCHEDTNLSVIVWFALFQVLVTSFSEISKNEYLDPRTAQVAKVDHVKQVSYVLHIYCNLLLSNIDGLSILLWQRLFIEAYLLAFLIIYFGRTLSVYIGLKKFTWHCKSVNVYSLGFPVSLCISIFEVF